jgi:hypothetical protein
MMYEPKLHILTDKKTTTVYDLENEYIEICSHREIFPLPYKYNFTPPKVFDDDDFPVLAKKAQSLFTKTPFINGLTDPLSVRKLLDVKTFAYKLHLFLTHYSHIVHGRFYFHDKPLLARVVDAEEFFNKFYIAADVLANHILYIINDYKELRRVKLLIDYGIFRGKIVRPFLENWQLSAESDWVSRLEKMKRKYYQRQLLQLEETFLANILVTFQPEITNLIKNHTFEDLVLEEYVAKHHKAGIYDTLPTDIAVHQYVTVPSRNERDMLLSQTTLFQKVLREWLLHGVVHQAEPLSPVFQNLFFSEILFTSQSPLQRFSDINLYILNLYTHARYLLVQLIESCSSAQALEQLRKGLEGLPETTFFWFYKRIYEVEGKDYLEKSKEWFEVL